MESTGTRQFVGGKRFGLKGRFRMLSNKNNTTGTVEKAMNKRTCNLQQNITWRPPHPTRSPQTCRRKRRNVLWSDWVDRLHRTVFFGMDKIIQIHTFFWGGTVLSTQTNIFVVEFFFIWIRNRTILLSENQRKRKKKSKRELLMWNSRTKVCLNT